MPHGAAAGDDVANFRGAKNGFFQVTLPQAFPFGESQYNRVFVSENGYLTFDRGVSAASPSKVSNFIDVPIIAPFWSNIDLRSVSGLRNDGRVFYKCSSRNTKNSRTSPMNQAIFNNVQQEIRTSIDFDDFSPTMVCTFTWSNVSPYPFNQATRRERNNFQVVLAFDRSNGKSFIICSYGTNTWVSNRKNAQGYKMKNFNIFYDQQNYAYDYFTSGTASSFKLKSLTGPKGRPGVWIFKTYFRQYPTRSDYKCFEWHEKQLLQQNSWLQVRQPACPCTLRQAMRDPRFNFFSNDFARGSVCYISNFPTFQSSAQQCCYRNRVFLFWNWWFRPFFWTSRSFLFTGRNMRSGSVLKYHPLSFRSLYIAEDLIPKRWCCEESFNCNLFYQFRPQNTCFSYRPPRFGFSFGDPHIRTLDGFEHTFNGIGEYWLSQSVNSINIQGRMQRYIEADGRLSNATIFTGFAFYDFSENVKSSKISVTLTKDRKDFVIMDDTGSESLVNWYYSNLTGIYTGVMNVGVRRNEDNLELSFPSGSSVSITIDDKSLSLALSIPEELYNKSLNGLYGIFDGKRENDLAYPNRTIIPLTSKERDIFILGQSWLLQAAESFFWYNTSAGESYSTFVDASFTPVFMDEGDNCRINVTEARVKCTKDGSLNRACLYDLCATADISFSQQTLDSSAEGTILVKESSANDVARLTSSTTEARFTVNVTTSFDISIVPPENTTTGNWSIQLTSNLTGAQLVCQDSTCLQWVFSYQPTSGDDFELSFEGNSTDGRATSALIIPVLMCPCSGNGRCDWSVLSLNSNQTDSFKTVTCDCLNGIYSGDNCDQLLDFCLNNECVRFGGNCSNLPEQQLVALYQQTNGSTTGTPPFKGFKCDIICPNGTIKDSLDICQDVDECLTTNACKSLSETCVNTFASYRCDCRRGFEKSTDNSTCIDVDECALRLSNCEQVCSNNNGSFACSCISGYDASNEKCTPNADLNCTPSSLCPFCTPSNNCICLLGFVENAKVCTDFDECTNGTATCDISSTNCVNTNGSYKCECKTGFSSKPEDSRACVACVFPYFGANCEQLASCPETSWSPVAGCSSCQNKGYAPPSCTSDLNECLLNSTICGSGKCTNTNGFYVCSCDPWFSFKNGGCQQLDACLYNRTQEQLFPGCGSYGVCNAGLISNSPGSFRCDCSPGFKGPLCDQKIDECVAKDCVAGGTAECEDLINAFRCKCKSGFSGPRCNYQVAGGTSDDVTTRAFVNTALTVVTFDSTTAATSNDNMTIQEKSIQVTAITLPIIFTSLSLTSVAVIFGTEILQAIFGIN